MKRKRAIGALCLGFVTAVVIAGCGGTGGIRPTGYTKAIIEPADVEQVIPLAKDLDGNSQNSAPSGMPWFEIKRGTRPAIVTAPHATTALRQGKRRPSDGGGTGAMAAALNAVCGVTVIYTTYASPSDPNFHDDNDFKARLAELIAEIKPVLLLDVHASHAYRPYEVDLGTMHGSSLLGKHPLLTSLVQSLRDEGIVNISHERFAASENQTITKYASARGVPAIQLEISATRTTFTSDVTGHRFAQTLQALARFLGKEGLCTRVKSQ